MTFRTRDFRRRTWHFADHADGYKALGLSTDEAVAWASRGFTPNEAAPWITEHFTADEAAPWADNFVAPADARAELDRRAGQC